MRVKHYARGKFYLIDCAPGSRVIRQLNQFDAFGELLPDLVVARFNDRDIVIPTKPANLLPLLAEAGRFGLSLVGVPRPDIFLAGASCPDCRECDAEWLWRVDDGPLHCDRCGARFEASRASTGADATLGSPPDETA